MTMPTKHQGTGVTFPGTIGAQKRLASVIPRLTLVKIGMYRGGLGFVWEADVIEASGRPSKRWVKYTAGHGWDVLKAPPAREAARS